MKVIFTPQSTIKDQYINPPVHENLFVIPYVKRRLVFAELTARAIVEGKFDLVLVDLPYFLNGGNFLDLPARFLPKVCSLVIKKANPKFMNIPFVANDAPCIAIAVVQMLRDYGNSIELRCIDDSNIINYQEYLWHPEPRLKDDYYAVVAGLETYFARPFEELSTIREKLSETNKFYLHYRAGQVAERILHLLGSGRRTLLVCEYSLWDLVCKILNAGKSPENPQLHIPWSNPSAALVVEDPYEFWALGLLDDFPRVVDRFYISIKSQSISTFDKLREINELIWKALSKKQCRSSFRKLLCFRRYLQNRISADVRFVPLPISHLYDAAQACMGPRVANEIARTLLRYPVTGKEDILKFLEIYQDRVVSGAKSFDLPDLSERLSDFQARSDPSESETIEDRMDVVDRIRPYDIKVCKQLGEENGLVRWELESDYELHQQVSAKAREMVDRKRRAEYYKVQRSWGSIRDGIHMKATIASRATGEDALYIKRNKSFLGPNKGKFTETTPMVFMFNEDLSKDSHTLVHDSNTAQRKIELGNQDLIASDDPAPDQVYSVYATYRKNQAMCGGHLFKEEITSLVILFHRYMGVQRYDAITKRPKKFQCRIDPRQDTELRSFTTTELGAAWAIKYAEDSIIVVAKDRWKASNKLLDFARRKGVEIFTLPLSNFSMELVERVKFLHTTSTALKKHPNRSRILKRFIQ
jgi:hypothetical protein